MLWLRSLLWTILLPGVVAGYVPWTVFELDRLGWEWRPGFLAGALIVAAGVSLLVACVIEFARTGRGPLSPLDPPRHLGGRGLYRYVRNPMYLSVTVILLGEVLLTRSRALAIYWAIWFAIVNLFVMAYEEPWLRGRFGNSYAEYAANVGRWLPRLPQQGR